MHLDHDVVLVDEFDALSIEIAKAACSSSVPGKDEKYPAKAHAKKVAQQLGVKTGLVYLPGLESQKFEDSDMAPEFRQRRYFYYMSGVDFPDAVVTYDIAAEKLTLWVPYMDPRQALYLGGVPSPEECLRRYDVDDCRVSTLLQRYVSSFLASHPGSLLYVLHENQAPRLDRCPRMVSIDHGRLLPAMDAARVVKSGYEVRAIRRANDVSSAAHRLVLTRLKGLTNETEVEAVYVGSCLAQGAKHQAYGVIAGSGPNAATLHYDANDEPLEGRQVVVLDAGAEWHCYASDITRTLPIGGRFTPEGSAVYAAVDRMQRECIERVRPGSSYRGLHALAQSVAVEELLKLGILRGGDVNEVRSSGVVSAFFPHGLGHHVGLEVHDVWSDRLMVGHAGGTASLRQAGKRLLVSPDFSAALGRAGSPEATVERSLGQGGNLVENMVITIEPGIYFNRSFIDAFLENEPKLARFVDQVVLERYYPVGGVRIEDDILVTRDGYEILSAAPKGEEALKIINQGR